MEAVGEFDDQDTDVLAGGDEELEEVVGSLGKIFVEIFHARASFA